MTAFAFGVAMAALEVNGPEDVPLPRQWDTVAWRRHEENVRRLRGRIFKATKDGDWPKVRNLQKMMVRHEARLFRMGVKDRHFLAVVAVG
jgi:RNA-directed DNA polymerase